MAHKVEYEQTPIRILVFCLYKASLERLGGAAAINWLAKTFSKSFILIARAKQGRGLNWKEEKVFSDLMKSDANPTPHVWLKVT